jgi:hypothetical protein
MLISRVTYTVKTEFVEQNKANVRAVMDAVRAGDNPGVKYSTYFIGDGQFLHLAVFADRESKQVLGALPEFQQFQAQLKENATVSPNAMDAELVGSTFDWF